MADEQMYAVIQGVRVPIMIVDGIELPLEAIQGYPNTIEIHNCSYDGKHTYTFWVKDPAYNLDTKNTFYFDPKANH